MQRAISHQHATDMKGLTVVPQRCHQLGQLPATMLDSILKAQVWCLLMLVTACRLFEGHAGLWDHEAAAA